MSVQEVAADETRVFADGDGIHALDIETGAVIGQLTPVCGFAVHLLVCGTTLLCLEFESDNTWAIDTITGEAEVIANRPFRFGCSDDGEVLWHDFARLGVGTGDDARTLALLPHPDPLASLETEGIFSVGDDVVLSLGVAAFYGTFVARNGPRAIAAVQPGIVLDVSQNGIVSFDGVENALFKIDLP